MNIHFLRDPATKAFFSNLKVFAYFHCHLQQRFWKQMEVYGGVLRCVRWVEVCGRGGIRPKNT